MDKDDADILDDIVEQSLERDKLFSVLFLGDLSFGESYRKRDIKRGRTGIHLEKDYDYFLENYKELLLQSDLVIANLEAPITKIRKSPFAGCKNYLGKEKSTTAPKTFNKFNMHVMNLANNHILDFGVQGLFDTMDALERHEIAYFGAGGSNIEAGMPFLFSQNGVDVAVFSGFEYREKYDSMYSFYAGENNAGVSSLLDIELRVSSIKERKPDTFVIVCPHWGKNYKWVTSQQRDLSKKIIEAGADLIIGHGAHCIQEVEEHGGKWMVYNIGNFIFNSPGKYAVKKAPPYSFITQLNLSDEGWITMSLYPILTNNLITHYQGRFLDQGEFDHVHSLLLTRSSHFNNCVLRANDNFGHYFELNIR